MLTVPQPDTMKNEVLSLISQESVLRDCAGSKGLEESLFIRPHKLHATIGVMCLMDNDERTKASQLLVEAKDSIVLSMLENHTPLKLRLKGLAYMNDDPKEMDVLYSDVSVEDGPPFLLQHLADALVEHFNKAGFIDNSWRDNVKLHVTLINTKYRSRSSTSLQDEDPKDSAGSRRSKKRFTFDGSQVLEKFSDYDFGTMELEEIHLSQCHSMSSDGFYQSTCVISCKKS